MVAAEEAVSAQGHALGDTTGAAPIRHKIGGPHETAHLDVVVFLN